MPVGHVAALPMYDFPYVAQAHEALWQAIRSHLAMAGVGDLPDQLSRHQDATATWCDPRLLLGQACEYPLLETFGPFVRIVATPCYSAPGCEGRLYRSAIVVRASDPTEGLAGLRQRRCAVNSPDSNSGMNLLRAALAPYARGAPFFSSVVPSGSHHDSARLVADGVTDVAAIDCVSYAHLRRCDPVLVDRLRILDWTPAAGSLPYVTSSHTGDATLRALRGALVAVTQDPALRPIRDALFLADIDVGPDLELSLTHALQRRAAELGYPRLV